jgi:probable phosphoglycerate mutase
VHLLIVRHGETTWNREGRIQGHRDSPLTERGLAQAKAAAARLARDRIDALYSSDLGRAWQTAREVEAATGIPVRIDAGLRERAFGVLEGMTWDEIGRAHPEHAPLVTRVPSHPVPGGESLVEFRERVLAAFHRIAREVGAGSIAVVTHGGVLGVLYREAMGIPLEAPRSYTTLNAGVNRFRYADEHWSVEHWGDTENLDDGSARDDL